MFRIFYTYWLYKIGTGHDRYYVDVSNDAYDTTLEALMKRLDMGLLDTLKSTYARLTYNGEVKVVKKARPVNDTMLATMGKFGVTPSEVGAPCPFAKVTKINTYTVSLGAALRYKKRVEHDLATNGVKDATYVPSQKRLGMFPVYGELLWCKDDFSCLYLRCYQTGIPDEAEYFGDGVKIPKVAVGQWLPSDDYKKLSGEWVAPPLVADEENDLIYAMDEDGNVVLDDAGQPLAIALPPVRSIKLENCKVVRKGKEISFCTDEEWTLEELEAIKATYYSKFEN